ncbi:MAG: tRNA (adenosine(37)-N6)-threonylcarbamoyltransferase complex ATPase subunit type 1 TsaE [Deltaproteobacteria bacterium]|nr:tRNA (adenosine(37)-N6)-threonylcarbamoyltransferase complex ATPase subunit type 1 TsaE [Deltaproteobacteria bacterium]
MIQCSIESHSLEDTAVIARVVADLCPSGCAIGLSGDLGAGKTEFVRGLVAALGSADSATSPTYALENVYPVRNDHRFSAVHHWDLYRVGREDPGVIEQIRELREDPRRLVVIEWPEKVPEVHNSLSLQISLSFRPGSDAVREIAVIGAIAAQICEKVRK